MIDLSKLMEKTDEVAVELKHPVTGEVLKDEKGNVAKVVVYGRASKRAQDYQNAKVNQILKDKSVNKNKEETAESLSDAILESVVVCVDRYENLSFGDKKLDNETTIKEALSNPALRWLYEQTRAAIDDQTNFF